MALKLLETKFIKDAWFANAHYQTWQTQRAIANAPGSASEYLAIPDQIRCPGPTFDNQARYRA
jgi:hypothetical protein